MKKPPEFSRRQLLGAAVAATLVPRTGFTGGFDSGTSILHTLSTPNADRLIDYVKGFRGQFATGDPRVLVHCQDVLTINPACFQNVEALRIESALSGLERIVISLDGGGPLTQASWRRLEKQLQRIREMKRRQLDLVLSRGMHQPFGMYE